MQLEDLIGALATQELKFEKKRLDRERVEQMKVYKPKGVALKRKVDETESDTKSNEEDMALLAR